MTLEIPWYIKSPSPWTLALWAVLIVWSSRILLQRVQYRRLRRLGAFTEAAFLLGFMVLMTDILWVLACGLRFARFFPFYPDVYGLILAAARDLAGLILFYMMIGGHFQQKIVQFNTLTYLSLAGFSLFLALWFGLAPDPSLTDWNYAYVHGYGLARIVQAFLLSHVLGRSFLVVAFYSMFRSNQGVQHNGVQSSPGRTWRPLLHGQKEGRRDPAGLFGKRRKAAKEIGVATPSLRHAAVPLRDN